MSGRRLIAVVRKEILHIVRDPRNLFLVALSPAFLLFLLSHVFSLDTSHIQLTVLDGDHTPVSREYVASLTSSQDVVLASVAESQQEILSLLVRGAADVGLVIPPGFADSLRSGRQVQVQALVDGADPFSGGQALRLLPPLSAAYMATSAGSLLPAGQLVEVGSQAWYNPGLGMLISMVPALLAIVLIMPTLALALALAREKETGTLEGLMATPLSGREYLIGKVVAYVAAGMASAILALLVATLYFRVPFRGSLAVYLLLTGIYLLACMGAALVIAHFVKSQQTAMFIVLLILVVPSFFLAGLITPVNTDSLGSLLTSYALPSTHFVEISRVVFLKGLGMAYLRVHGLILLGMGVGALAIGLLIFRKRVG